MVKSGLLTVLCLGGAAAFTPLRPSLLRRSVVSMSSPPSKKDARKSIMGKEDFIRSPNVFKQEKAVVDAMMLAEFKVSSRLVWLYNKSHNIYGMTTVGHIQLFSRRLACTEDG